MNSSDKLMQVPSLQVRCRGSLALWLVAGWCFVASAPVAAQAASELDRARDLHLRGEREEALRHYRAFLSQPETPVADRATALNNTCVLLHDLGDVVAALDACGRALKLRRDLAEPRGLSRTLNNLGLALQSAGRYAEAAERYREALAINRARRDIAAAAVNLANLGLLASDEGRYGPALEYHGEVEALAAEHAGEPWAGEQRRVAWINRGVVYEKLGAYDQALELYQRLLAEQEALGPRRWATVLLNLGTVYRNLGDPHLAAASYDRAAAIFEREDDRAALASARLNLGQVQHLDLLQPAMAETSLRAALELARQNGDRGVEIQALFLLGDLYLDQGDTAQARSSFESCLALSKDSGTAEGEWSARYGLGRLAAEQDGDAALELALAELNAAIDGIERTRAHVGNQTLRGGFFASWRHVYESAVEVHWRRFERDGDPGDALASFHLVQRAKQRELVEAVGGAPRAVSSADADAGFRPIAEALAAMGDATLVEYFFTSDSLFAWRLDAAGLRWTRPGPAVALAESAAAVHEALAAGHTPPPQAVDFLSTSLALGDTPERLVLAPDGALRYLPFEILPAGPDPADLLVARRRLSYLPSASALPGLAERATDRRAYRLVALADPEPAGGGESPSPALRTGGLFTSRFVLARLPSGRREIERAAEQLGGQHLLRIGEQATVQALRDAMAAGSRVLHLAAHTVIDERPGGGAAVLLTADGDDDGLLGPSDLAHLDLRADLTVLAACRTAVGRAGDGGSDTGDGSALGSLTGAFLAAGSGAVLATLWDVGDEATEVFMEQFYYQLGRGLEPSRALAEVKRRMSHDPHWRAPHLWSAYVLVGDAPPVLSAGDAFWHRNAAWVGTALMLLLLLAVIGVVHRRRSVRLAVV